MKKKRNKIKRYHKIISLLLCICIIASMFILPMVFIEKVGAIGQHEVADGTFIGYIENDTNYEGASHTFDIEQDSMVKGGTHSGENYGWQTHMLVSGNTVETLIVYGYIQFDISTIPSCASVVSARMYMTFYGVTIKPPPNDIYAYRNTQTWDEDTITWDNKPAYDASYTDYVNCEDSHTWYYWNVTSDVQSFVAGTKTNYGWTLRPNETNDHVASRSKEDTYYPDDHPYLEIEYEFQFDGTRDASVITEVNNCSFIPSINHSDNVTLKIPVSTDVGGIIDVTNNTDDIQATKANNTDELVNNSYWYDFTNQTVYIRTTDITTTMTVNWTVNCSYLFIENFNATTYNGTQINITWTKSNITDTTYIMVKNDSLPENRSDGDLLYNGSSDHFEDSGLLEGFTRYYRAWAYNASFGFSDRYTGAWNTTLSEDPTITNVTNLPLVEQVNGSWVNITCNVTDNVGVQTVKAVIDCANGSTVNESMTLINTDGYYYNTTYNQHGTYNYTIWVNDTSGNQNTSSQYSFYIYNYTLRGVIYNKSGVLTDDVTISITDNNTAETLYNVTYNNGNYSRYLEDFPSGYSNGDTIWVYGSYLDPDSNSYENGTEYTLGAETEKELNLTLNKLIIVNNPPDKPTLLTPSNNSVNNSINPTLSCQINDSDGDPMTVRFYNYATNNSIHTKTGQYNGTVNFVWSGRSANTTYHWYVKASDPDENTSDTWKFTTTKAPAGNFTFLPAIPTTSDTVNFTDNSSDEDGTITNYTWDFGDSSTSYLENPTHSYSDNGIYTVNLTVKDDKNAVGYHEEQITVLNVAPIASYTYTKTGAQLLTINTDASGSSDSDGFISSYTWNWGDTYSSSGITASHTYSTEKNYAVKLTVVDDDGASDSETKTIFIGTPNVAPVAGFSYSTPLYAGQSISFTDESTDSDGTIASWSWSFGDGETSTQQNTSHTYNNIGTYLVKLIVTDNESATDTESKYLTIVSSPGGGGGGGNGGSTYSLIIVVKAEGSGLPGVNVSLYKNNRLVQTKTTDVTGKVRFTGLRGLYVVKISHEGYDDVTKTYNVNENKVETINLDSGMWGDIAGIPIPIIAIGGIFIVLLIIAVIKRPVAT